MNLNEIKVVDKDISFDNIAEYIDFVVDSSYDSDGVYHEYLKDYASAIAVISLYTDYDGEDFDISEVMNFIWNLEGNWSNIKDQLGYKWEMFTYYVRMAIKYKNAPMRQADQALSNISDLAKQVIDIISKIDFENLSKYDFSKIIQAADAVNQIKIENNESN